MKPQRGRPQAWFYHCLDSRQFVKFAAVIGEGSRESARIDTNGFARLQVDSCSVFDDWHGTPSKRIIPSIL